MSCITQNEVLLEKTLVLALNSVSWVTDQVFGIFFLSSSKKDMRKICIRTSSIKSFKVIVLTCTEVSTSIGKQKGRCNCERVNFQKEMSINLSVP